MFRLILISSLAYMEMRLALATILLRYNIELSSNVLETTEGFMHKPLKMMVKFSRRKPTTQHIPEASPSN